jgi:hypothetical protein
MNIQPVQSSPPVQQTEALASAQAAAKQAAPSSVIPQDRVTIRSAARAKASSGDVDHDHDSK